MENRSRLYSNACAQQLCEKALSPLSPRVSYAAATCLEHVETAWKLVYERYVATGLITPNSHGIHLSSHALHADACVVVGKCSQTGRAVSTMTLIADSFGGLSLDSVFRRELNALRADGRRLLEVGLLVADCNGGARSDMTSLFEMMKWAAYYSRQLGLSDIVIGVHPHHAKFYTRCYGFEQFGPETVYPMVRNRPVVPLRLRLNEQLALQVLPRGLRHVRDYPLSADVFSNRYKLCRHELKDSTIERFLVSTRQPQSELDGLRRPRWFNVFRRGWSARVALATAG